MMIRNINFSTVHQQFDLNLGEMKDMEDALQHAAKHKIREITNLPEDLTKRLTEKAKSALNFCLARYQTR